MSSRSIPYFRSAVSLVLLLAPIAVSAQANYNREIQQTMGMVMQTAISTLNFLTWIAFIVLNELLNPNIIFDGGSRVLSPMLQKLNTIWQLSRDIMNVVFAVALIGAVVYTVITGKKDFVASNMKKFVMAVVLVNFSWFIPMVVLDAANIAAATVFNLPSALGTSNICKFKTTTPPLTATGCTGGGSQNLGNGARPVQECNCVMAVDAKFFVSDEGRNGLLASQGWECHLGQTMCVRLQPLNTTDVAPSSYILNGLILNHARLAGLATLPPAVDAPKTSQLIMYFIQMGVLLVIHIALLFPLAAMALAFAIRIPVIWFSIAFMPFWILTLLPLGSILGDYPKKLGDTFIQAAFLPAICAVPLTIGFIMINAGQQALTFQNMKVIDFRLTDNISSMYELLWLVMCLGIFYMGTFSVLKKYGGVMAKGAEMIEGAGKSMGRMAIQAPLHVPIPGMSMSPLRMMQKWSPSNMESNFKSSSNLVDFGKKMTDGTAEKTAVKASQAETSARRHAGTSGSTPAEVTTLCNHLDRLTSVMAANDLGAQRTTVETINRDYGLNLDINNPKTDLPAVVAAYVRQNPAIKTQLERSANAVPTRP